jgi:hypothetical protein
LVAYTQEVFCSPGSFPLFSKERKNKEAKKATNQNFKKIFFLYNKFKKEFQEFLSNSLKIFKNFFDEIFKTFQLFLKINQKFYKNFLFFNITENYFFALS